MDSQILKITREKVGLALMASIFSISSLFAVGQQEIEESNEIVSDAELSGSVTITDGLAREVTVSTPVKHIAYSHYSAAEVLKILDAWDLVTARDGFTSDKIIFTNLDEIPALGPPMGNCYEPNFEILFNMDIDLFIVDIVPLPGMEELIKTLEPEITVVALDTHDPGKICDSIEKLGILIDRGKEAREYIAWYTDIVRTLINRCSTLLENEKPRVLFKSGYGSPEDLMTVLREESYSGVRDRCTGSVNLATDLPSEGRYITTIDPEWLITQELDAVVVLDPVPIYGALMEDYAPLIEYRRKVMGIPALAGSRAVKTDSVYMLSSNTPCVIEFAYMAKWFHPEIFEDFTPSALHQEYLSRFMDVDVDFPMQRIYAYPNK